MNVLFVTGVIIFDIVDIGVVSAALIVSNYSIVVLLFSPLRLMLMSEVIVLVLVFLNDFSFLFRCNRRCRCWCGCCAVLPQSRRPSFCPINENEGKDGAEDCGKTAVVFSIKNEVGCLVKALRLFQVSPDTSFAFIALPQEHGHVSAVSSFTSSSPSCRRGG